VETTSQQYEATVMIRHNKQYTVVGQVFVSIDAALELYMKGWQQQIVGCLILKNNGYLTPV
jgi:hypothetical protein